MKMFKHLILASSLVIAPVTFAVAAEPTVGEKVDETYQDTKKSVKKGYRKAKDEVCEMVNGKMECAAKKLGHKAKNVGDEVKDKVDDAEKHTN